MRAPGAFLLFAVLALVRPAQAEAEGSGPGEAGAAPPLSGSAAAPSPAFSRRLAITVVTAESALPTFEERVGSWLDDGTEVALALARDASQEALLAADASEVRVWVVPLSPERALVTFSLVAEDAAPRHLVREVRLRNGLDDLGLERLASVIHSAFIALREGVEGSERALAERELSAAGIASSAPPESVLSAGAVEPPPVTAPGPAPRPRERPAPARAAADGAALLVAAGYGARFRGVEGTGQGPTASLGARLPAGPGALLVLLGGQFLFQSTFQTEGVHASLETGVLRARLGFESALSPRLAGAVLAGAGVDVAGIDPMSSTDGASEPSPSPRAAGTHVRAAGELTCELWWRIDRFDLGALAQLTFLPGDVHYGLQTPQGPRRLAAPWPVQPGFALQARFRSPL